MISVFVATSGRAEMFGDMLVSLRDTTQGWDVETIVVIDDDERALELATLWEADVIDYSKKRRGALKAWNIGLSHCDGHHLIPAGDDQIFHKGWLEFALESHKENLNGYGVVGMNDLAYDGNKQLATMFLFDRQYCKDVMGGIFAPPMYHYYCVDSEWNEKAKMSGRFYWDERSKVEHLHSAHGKRPVDATDALKETMWMEIDNTIFESRKAQGFPVTWDSII
jgi:glycosyltransferase involved in cell wall biosynthesis